MRHVEIAPGVVSSVLGFGCAPIQGSVGGKAASRALDCALDCGVTHFDLARSYGYGDAEAFVGKHLLGRRDKVVIASKFGIRANWKATFLKPLKPVVRALRSKKSGAVHPTSRPVMEAGPTVADRFHDRIPLNGQSMRSSLEKSLAATKAGYLDVLFVHEPLSKLDQIEDLIATGQQLKYEGKIRALGLAIPWSSSTLHSSYLNEFDVLQFDNSPGAGHYKDVLVDRSGEVNIFFSPLRCRVASAQDTLTKMWCDFPKSIILCSMFKEEHIRQNAAWASGKP